jgi:hypothetical protein
MFRHPWFYDSSVLPSLGLMSILHAQARTSQKQAVQVGINEHDVGGQINLAPRRVCA